jgi:hypothetical protein
MIGGTSGTTPWQHKYESENMRNPSATTAPNCKSAVADVHWNFRKRTTFALTLNEPCDTLEKAGFSAIEEYDQCLCS